MSGRYGTISKIRWNHFNSISLAAGKQARWNQEQELFGDSILNLSRTLYDQVKLPERVREAERISPRFYLTASAACLRPGERFSQWLQQEKHERLFFDRTFTLILANQLSAQGDNHWYHRQTLKRQQVLARQTYTQLDAVINACHQAVVSLDFQFPDTIHPAAKLLQYWDSSQPETALSTQAEDQTAPIEAATDTIPDIINLLMDVADPAQTTEQRLAFALKEIFNHLDLEQMLFLAYQPRKKLLKTYYSKGFGKQSEVKTITIEVQSQRDKSLVKQLLAKPAALIIDDRKLKPVKTSLPSALAAHVNSDSTVITSMFMNSTPLGLMLCNKTAITSNQVQQLKQLNLAAGKGLAKLAKLRHYR